MYIPDAMRIRAANRPLSHARALGMIPNGQPALFPKFPHAHQPTRLERMGAQLRLIRKALQIWHLKRQIRAAQEMLEAARLDHLDAETTMRHYTHEIDDLAAQLAELQPPPHGLALEELTY